MSIRLIPIYTTPKGEGCFGYSFKAPADGSEPCEWAWVAGELEFVPSDDGDCDQILFGGHWSPIFPHELMYRNRKMDALPLALSSDVEDRDEPDE